MAKKTTFTNNVPTRISATHYQAQSDSNDQIIYDLTFDGKRWTCTCPSPERPCKHARTLVMCIRFASKIFPDPSQLEHLSQSLLNAQSQVEDLLIQIEGLQATNAELAEVVAKTAKRNRPVKEPTVIETRDLVGQLVKLRVSGRAVRLDEYENVVSCSCGDTYCWHWQAAEDYLRKLNGETCQPDIEDIETETIAEHIEA